MRNNVAQLITECHCQSDKPDILGGHLPGCPNGDMDYCEEYHGTRSHVATVIVPIRTVSELNRHEHWRHRQKRARAQRAAVMLIVPTRVTFPYRPEPVHVHITRLAARKLDTDNLASSQKAARDAIATLLGVDDGNERLVTWSYGQEQQRGYAVRIEFYRRSV